MNKLKFVFIIILFCFLFVGCNKQKDIIFKTEEEIIELNIQESYKPKLIIENIDNYELEYKYDTEIIKIENGTILGLLPGNCEVIISIKNHNEVDPIILYIDVIEVEATSIICEEEIKILLDQTYQLKAKVQPTNAIQEVTYSSNNKKVAEVTEEGLIKGIGEGQTYIVVKSKNYPNIRTRVLVIVEKPPVEKIETIDNITLDYNETYQLTWNIIPSNSLQDVIFESSNEEIASVDENGLISAYKYGTTTIKIISVQNNLKYAEIIVNVEGVKAQEIVIDNVNIDLQLGEEYKLEYNIIPSNACQGLDIIVSDAKAIEVNNNTIFANKVGNYIITLNTIDGTNINKVINVNITGEEIPIFITNSQFDEQSIISWNEEFDPLLNIKAVDNKDGDITEKIVLKGQIDNRSYGEYILEYYIEDSDGHSQTLVRTVNVVWSYDTVVIGHAGSYYGVPNSEEAILYAADVLKYPAIEIDLKQTKDGIFVLSHDPNWGDAKLEETNYEDLKDVEYKVTKNKGVVEGNLTEKERTYTAKICTFERYLEICKSHNIIAVIELKTSKGISNWTEANAPKTSRMPEIMKLIKKYDMLDKVVFLSSQELCLNWVKTNGYEYIPCQYLTLSSCENENTYNIVKKYNLDISFNVRDGIKISDEWLQKYRDLGCKLAVFTFEEYASYSDIQTWIDRGADYVTTDWHSLDKLKFE